MHGALLVGVDINYGLGGHRGTAGPVLNPDGSNVVEMYRAAYVAPKSVIAYWPTNGWYRRGAAGY